MLLRYERVRGLLVSMGLQLPATPKSQPIINMTTPAGTAELDPGEGGHALFHSLCFGAVPLLLNMLFGSINSLVSWYWVFWGVMGAFTCSLHYQHPVYWILSAAFVQPSIFVVPHRHISSSCQVMLHDLAGVRVPKYTSYQLMPDQRQDSAHQCICLVCMLVVGS